MVRVLDELHRLRRLQWEVVAAVTSAGVRCPRLAGFAPGGRQRGALERARGPRAAGLNACVTVAEA